MKQLKFLILLFSASVCFSQQNDSIFLREIYNQALSKGKAYEDLRSLCKDVGARLSGSSEAQMAVEWGKKKLEGYCFDRVYLQEIKVPHWERGTKESGWIQLKNGQVIKTQLLALGGSVGTAGLMEGEIIEFKHLDELKKAKASAVNGKIVFLNQAMNESQINTFKAYGGCYSIRAFGAVEAARLGAKAILIRSIGMPVDHHPHTGSMHYNDSVKKIPAAAISTADAEILSKLLMEKSANHFKFELDCRDYVDAVSYNVIAEMKGTKFPNEIITFGGHLDSWDTGEGAHDDGAGIVHCMEALRILKELKYKPQHTLRLVFFMNEENGNMGGKSYAEMTDKNKEKVVAALESDRGGFSPRGFHCDGPEHFQQLLKSFAPIFKPYELSEFDKGYGGVDISPLKNYNKEIPLFGFVPDSQRYFDFHHAPSDVFENVNKRELELGCAAIAGFIYLLDKSLPVN